MSFLSRFASPNRIGTRRSLGHADSQTRVDFGRSIANIRYAHPRGVASSISMVEARNMKAGMEQDSI